MLNYLMHLCQTFSPVQRSLKDKFGKNIFLLSGIFTLSILLNGCARHQTHEEKAILRSIEALPYWFKVDERFSARGKEGEYPIHPFFDLAPFAELKENAINFYVVTPQGSPFGYNLDLLTGKLYKTFKYCDQKDIWSKYSSKINSPPFTMGMIPRLLDQWGNPQEVIVFGRPDFYKGLDKNINQSFRARIVGGVIDQYCKKIPCSVRNAWDSHLLLVAIDLNDPRFSEVVDLEQLKKIVDWPQVNAFLQNGRGRKSGKDSGSAAYRVVGEVAVDKAFKYALTQGHYFEFDELKTIRQNCQKLYDYTWESSQLIRKNLKETKSKEKLSNFVRKMKTTNVISDEQEQETKQEKKTQNFTGFFNDFYNRFGDRFFTCSRMVSYSNINFNPDRHWFLTYMVIFFKLEKMGYYFSCEKKAWLENPRKADNTWTFDPSSERGKCRDRDFDMAFDSAITKLGVLRQGNEEHYRYADYDSSEGGSHEKLHAWIPETGKELQCSDRSSESDKTAKMKGEDRVKIFPEDIFWKEFSIPDEYSSKDFIIR